MASQLYGLPWYQGVPGPELDQAAAMGKYRRYRAGDTLLQPGAPANRGYLIISGCVMSRWVTPTGEFRASEVLGTGMLAGVEAYSHEEHPVIQHQALVITDVEVLEFPREYMLQAVAIGGWSAMATIQIMAHRFHCVSRKLITREQPILWRTAYSLLYLKEILDQDVLPVTQTLLSQLAGTNREEINRSLRTLRKRGLVQLGRGWIEILDSEELKDVMNHLS